MPKLAIDTDIPGGIANHMRIPFNAHTRIVSNEIRNMGAWYRRHPERERFVVSYNKHMLVWNDLTNMVYVGKKNVLQLTTYGGKIITLAHGHEIATPEGWKKIEDLKRDDYIYTQGKTICICCHEQRRVAIKATKYQSVCFVCLRYKIVKQQDPQKYYEKIRSHCLLTPEHKSLGNWFNETYAVLEDRVLWIDPLHKKRCVYHFGVNHDKDSIAINQVIVRAYA